MRPAFSAHDATNPRASAWVSANAGAGKTHLLANRVTRLLLDGVDPARILCLTYTKAAAAEMSSRLFDRLGAWALLSDKDLHERLAEIDVKQVDADILRRARRLFAQALETPGGLKIQTIHSFCQHVLARFPVEAGIPARFTVLDERSAAELMQGARNAVLERAGTGDARLADAVATLAARAGDGRFADILDLAIGDSRRLRDVLAQHGNDEAQLFVHLRQVLDVASGADEDSIVAQFCAEMAEERARWIPAAMRLNEGSTNDQKLALELIAFNDSDKSASGYEHLRTAFLTQKGDPRKTLATKKIAESDPELLGLLEDLQTRIVAVELQRKAAVTVTLTEALVSVARAVLGEYDKRKRARAALDYDDLTLFTLSLLEGKDAAAWVLYKLDGGIDHILVDEAQDTSPHQWRIIRKLAEDFFTGESTRDPARPRTLFAVGDEKQSIFSFQGAVPEEFGNNLTLFKLQAEAAKLGFADVRLLVSRRSASSVLEFIDVVFESAALRDGLTSAGATGAAGAAGAIVLHEPYRKEIGRVEIWPAVKPDDSAPPDPWEKPVDAPSATAAHVVLAARIAERIAHWQREKTMLPGTTRAIHSGDIMILVRRRNAFAEEMIRQLLERDIAVAGADRMVLLDQIAIADLVALGRFALLPEDDLNLAALLKSPLIDFGEEELFALAHGRDGRLWTELERRCGESQILAQAHAFLAEMRKVADTLPPFEFYARALSRGGRRKLVTQLGPEAADAIDEFLALALAHEGAHAPSLESFLDWFRRGASEVKRDMEQGGGAVRVMTVHGAKGLEAEIVFVPDTAQTPDHGQRAGILYTDDCLFFGVSKTLETGPVIAAKTQAHAREMREYRRLLYVALTRAREWLIVCGYENKKGMPADAWYPALKEAAKRIGRAETDETGNEIYALGLNVTAGKGKTAASVAKSAALPAFLRRAAPDLPPRTRVLRPSEDAGAGEPACNSPITAAVAGRFRRGLLVHTLLAALPGVEQTAREGIALRYLARRGIEDEDARSLIDETLRVLAHPDFAPLFAQDSRAEVRVSAFLPELGAGLRVSGTIDRLAVTKSRVFIADFKTNRPPPASPAQTPAPYLAQMALYRAALMKIYPAKRVAAALIWTDGARLMELPEALLDAEFARIAKRLVA